MLYYFWKQGKGLPVKTESSVFLSYITLQSNAVLCSVFLWWCKSFFFSFLFFFFFRFSRLDFPHLTAPRRFFSEQYVAWVSGNIQISCRFLSTKTEWKRKKRVGKAETNIDLDLEKDIQWLNKEPCSCFGIFFQLAGTRADQKNGKCQQTL